MTDSILPVNSLVSETLGAPNDYYDASTAHYHDFYQLANLVPGTDVNVSLSSSNFDTVLTIYNANSGQIIGSNDDGGAGTNSQFTFTPVFGDQDSYFAIVTSYAPNSTGSYNISSSQQLL
jgi:hypothetical protein